MSAPDLPPTPPPEFQLPNVYLIDPVYQRRFTYIWAGVVGAAVLYSLPHAVWSFKSGYTRTVLEGVREDWEGEGRGRYEWVEGGDGGVWEDAKKGAVATSKSKSAPAPTAVASVFHGIVSALRSFTMWTPPYVGLDVGQILLVVIYYVVLILLTTMQAKLMDNPDRAGFLAIAQLPLVFLLATKNSPLSILLGAGRGWEKLNFLHRWSGRGLFLCAALHGALWIRNHLEYGLPILGQVKETTGVASLGILGVLVLSSLKCVRVWWYEVFVVSHILGFVSFFVTMCYHTPYAMPWIFPALAFFGFDMFLRMIKFKVKDAVAVACDEQMTLIRIGSCDTNWRAGQHVLLRTVFDLDRRALEAHPLTVMHAPREVTCLESVRREGGMWVGVRAVEGSGFGFGLGSGGGWSGWVGRCAREGEEEGESEKSEVVGKEFEVDEDEEAEAELNEKGIVEVTLGSPSSSLKNKSITTSTIPTSRKSLPHWLTNRRGTPLHVLLDGPYGGCGLDPGQFESVLLVAGGSGATFTLGLLDELVGRIVRLRRNDGERTRRVEFVWCVRSFGALRWFSPFLTEIAHTAAKDPSLDLHISVFVTCLCDPESIPSIPNCDVTIERPTVTQIIRELLARPVRDADGSFADVGERTAHTVATVGGGLAVCAAGPEGLIRESKNAVARVAVASGVRLGRVKCHTEVYSV